MNCKEGDLAVLVEGPRAGAICRCIDRYDGPWAQAIHMPGWRVEWQTPHPDYWEMCVDFALRPIRDPGDDAVDQFARTKVTTLDACEPVLKVIA